MADESEPESKPITVSELIARSEGDDAFPRSESMSVRRAGRRSGSKAGPTASGMPQYRAPQTADDTGKRRDVGASGMPGYTPPATPESESGANAVTGIIPVVPDDSGTGGGDVRTASADDFIDDDLPATEYRSVAADSSPMVQVRRSEQASSFDETASIPVVDDEPDEQRSDREEADGDDFDGDDLDGEDRDDTESAGSGVAAKAAGGAAAVSAGIGGFFAGRAARKAAKADQKAARTSGKTATEPSTAPDSEPANAEGQQSDNDRVDNDEPTEALAPVADTSAAGAQTSSVRTSNAPGGEDDARAETRESTDSERSPLLGWLAFVGEIVLGLAVGAGLFWGFTELWKRYVYLALVLAIVVIFAVVTFAHLLRKRDLPTTLLALGVGMVVTMGPLVLLAAQP